jgi:putative membrane protein
MDPENMLSSDSPGYSFQRASQHLAAETTFLAWIRTSISVISLGFVLAKFGVWLREISQQLKPGSTIQTASASLPIGIAMMAIGGVLALLALWHFHVVNLDIERGRVRANRALVVTVATSVAALALLVIINLLCTKQTP